MNVYKLGGQIFPPDLADVRNTVYFSYEITADTDEAAVVRAQLILDSESRLRHGREVAATLWHGERIVKNLGAHNSPERVMGMQGAAATGSGR